MPRSGKRGSKAERDALRQEMLVSGCSLELIADEMERRWAFRPREAYRHAQGWSQDEVASRFTEVADRIGAAREPGPDGRLALAQVPMIGTRIGEYERWPSGGRRPSPYVLTVLSTVLGTTVERLVDYEDHRKMPDQERTVLAAVLAATSPPLIPSEPAGPPVPARPPLGQQTQLHGPVDRPASSDPADYDGLPDEPEEPDGGAVRRPGTGERRRTLGVVPDPDEPAATILPFAPDNGDSAGRTQGDGPRGGTGVEPTDDAEVTDGPVERRGLDWPDEPDRPVGTDPVRSGELPGSRWPGGASQGASTAGTSRSGTEQDDLSRAILRLGVEREARRIERTTAAGEGDPGVGPVAIGPEAGRPQDATGSAGAGAGRAADRWTAGADAASAARRHRRDQMFAGAGATGARSDEEVIMDAAGQSAEFGEWAEGTNVGATTLEQLDDDIRRISREYLNNPPLPLLLSTLRARNRVFTLLEGRQHPEQTRHLYLDAGRLCGLLAWIASDVGRHNDAETQARTAWLCAELAGSDGLRAWVRAFQSKVAYWDGRIRESADLAADGLRFPAPDSARVLLASLGARAWARLGATDEAHAALHIAQDERERAGEDEIGGLLGFSAAQQSYLAGSTHLWLQEPQEALAAADRAAWLFDVGSQSVRFYGAEMLALVDASAALVQDGELDGAAQRLQPVLELPPEQQLDTFTSRLEELRDGLRRSRHAMSRPAVEMQRQIEEFRAGALGQILSR